MKRKQRQKTPLIQVRLELRATLQERPTDSVSSIAERLGCSAYAVKIVRAEMEREGELGPRGGGYRCIGVWVLPSSEAIARQAVQSELSGLRNRVRELEAQLREAQAVVSPEVPLRSWGRCTVVVRGERCDLSAGHDGMHAKVGQNYKPVHPLVRRGFDEISKYADDLPNLPTNLL